MPTAVPDYSELEAVLGYRFSQRGLLEQALRHASWCNEHTSDKLEDNERLEFLGDAVLDLVVGHQLMKRFPQLRGGELSVTGPAAGSRTRAPAVGGPARIG